MGGTHPILRLLYFHSNPSPFIVPEKSKRDTLINEHPGSKIAVKSVFLVKINACPATFPRNYRRGARRGYNKTHEQRSVCTGWTNHQPALCRRACPAPSAAGPAPCKLR